MPIRPPLVIGRNSDPVVIFESHARTAFTGTGGIAEAKAKGAYKGRPASIEAARVRIESPRALGATESAKALGISRANVYRVLSAGA